MSLSIRLKSSDLPTLSLQIALRVTAFRVETARVFQCDFRCCQPVLAATHKFPYDTAVEPHSALSQKHARPPPDSSAEGAARARNSALNSGVCPGMPGRRGGPEGEGQRGVREMAGRGKGEGGVTGRAGRGKGEERS
ncbi:hypothetical protein E2C01_067824 [Portunus trituberculatus]|uniref:Uncharacterized protein n=1 Tax=Portunus trituberculatus TaxID=210409 RepID=A0A5B7HQB9_PORTR|nr:hypothetical protein [Portunus trituberculatus]